MKYFYEVAKHNPLWNGIGYNDFETMLECFNAKSRFYKKGDLILIAGDAVTHIGLILSGSVKIIKEDSEGNINILSELSASELFGEAFACANLEHSPVTVQATSESEILFINYKKVIHSCPSSCKFHTQLIANMLNIMAKKNLMLNRKIEILSKRTTRDKLLLFFDMHRGAAKKFTIPYNREELAHYLCVDRSAMSNELGKLRDEGIIRFHKNEFEIL